MERLPFTTPEEKKLVFAQAKNGDRIAINFLQQEYSLRVFTWEEIDAMNLLLGAGVVSRHTKSLLEIKEGRRLRW